MPSTYSTRLRLELQATGENRTTWGTKTNTSLNLIEQAIAGWEYIAMSDANMTLTAVNGGADQSRSMILSFSGTLTAARTITIPSVSKLYIVRNLTSGGFALNIKTAAGAAISVPNGMTMPIICDGTGMDFAVNGLPIAQGGTGATTAAGARTALGLGTAATAATGTSGATLPFLNGNNTWSGTNSYSTGIVVTNATVTNGYDLSRHLKLFDGYGFAITNSTLNHVSGSGHAWWSGTTNIATMGTGGAFYTVSTVTAGSDITATTNFVVNGAGNTHLWYRTNGVNRGLLYHAPSTSEMNWQLYNSAGAFVRQTSFRESDGRFYVNGFIQSGSNTYIGDGSNIVLAPQTGSNAAGSVYLRPDGSADTTGELHIHTGNIAWNGTSLVRADGGNWAINVTGAAGYLRQGGTGSNMTFNWSGQAGQPNWLWGGNDGVNHYVYNPSNFSVAYAANAGAVGGVGIGDIATVSKSSNVNETSFPIGTTLIASYGAVYNRNAAATLHLYTGNSYMFMASNGTGLGSALAGTWRARGLSSGNDSTQAFERVA